MYIHLASEAHVVLHTVADLGETWTRIAYVYMYIRTFQLYSLEKTDSRAYFWLGSIVSLVFSF